MNKLLFCLLATALCAIVESVRSRSVGTVCDPSGAVVQAASMSGAGTFDSVRFADCSNERDTIRYDGIEA